MSIIRQSRQVKVISLGAQRLIDRVQDDAIKRARTMQAAQTSY